MSWLSWGSSLVDRVIFSYAIVGGEVSQSIIDDYIEISTFTRKTIAWLAAMKVRAFLDRDRSHKRQKDLADLHALLWYVADYNDVKTGVLDRVTDANVRDFEPAVDPISPFGRRI